MGQQLGARLPAYMVPAAFHWRESLPLTDNGKTDRKALAADLQSAKHNGESPNTATEERLAAAWSDVLGIARDQIGRHDKFFDLGGTSLSALKLVIALDRAVTLKDLTQHSGLADLAALLDQRGALVSGD
jgi:hypothetical protein